MEKAYYVICTKNLYEPCEVFKYNETEFELSKEQYNRKIKEDYIYIQFVEGYIHAIHQKLI